MKPSEYPEIPADVLARANRRLFVGGLFAIVLGVANILGGAALYDGGIERDDILSSAIVALICVGCIFAGRRVGLKRLAEKYRAGASDASHDNAV